MMVPHSDSITIDSLELETRAAILREARSWTGTPFHHQASRKGAGADCLGLVRGVWRGLYGSEPEAAPAYPPDWAEATGAETLLAAARRNLCARGFDEARPGDVLLFRLRRHGPARHCGFLGGDPDARPGLDSRRASLIHAWSGRAVAEVPLDAAWRRRLSHVFRFPG